MFFITGLPRSRTAWFSAFMTASGYPCLHEGVDGCHSIDEYLIKVDGVSDSNTGFAFIGNPLPDRPILIIHREGRHKDNAFLHDACDKLNSLAGLHVDFDDIDKRMEEIFKHLTGNDLNANIYDLFRHLNITTTKAMCMESVEDLINDANQ